MNVTQMIENFYEESPLVFMKTIPIGEVFFDDRAKFMCKFGCKNFNRKFSCPPYSLSTYKKVRNYNFNWVILFATSYKFNNNYSKFKTKFLYSQKEYEIQRISHQLFNLINFNGHKNLVFSGGSCKRCRPCSCVEGSGCKKPSLKQISMEAIQIDCIKTLTNAGFDLQLTNYHTLNRCGCIFTNDENLSNIFLKKKDSFQKFTQTPVKEVKEYLSNLSQGNSRLFEEIEIIPIEKLKFGNALCKQICKYFGYNYSCPPFSRKINLALWKNAIIWKWKENKFKKYRYNLALKKLHEIMYSFGYYFALSIRDCYCNECNICSFSDSNKKFCQNRKMLSPSMQSQGINPREFGIGKFGIELF